MDWLAGIALALAAVPPPAAPPPEPRLGVQRFGLYVLADDVERSAAFYERIFGTPPQVRTPTLVAFDVAGGLYAVASRKAYAPEAQPGAAVRGYMKVENISAAFEHVRRVAPEALETAAVVKEGPFSFFRVADPDGNLLEFFAIARPAE